MRIEPVERARPGPPEAQRIYDAVEEHTGGYRRSARCSANKPELLRAFNQLYGVVWAEGAGGQAEGAGLPTGVDFNGCGY